MAQDRAAVVAAAVMRVAADALRDGNNNAAMCKGREAIAAYLRDEIYDVERTARDEREVPDA